MNIVMREVITECLSGNHGTFGPPLSFTKDQVLEVRAEKCPLTRCLSAREARLRKRGKSQKKAEGNIY